MRDFSGTALSELAADFRSNLNVLAGYAEFCQTAIPMALAIRRQATTR
jgi:hypothetical protein